MSWDIKYLPEADKDLDRLSRQQQVLVKKDKTQEVVVE